MKSNGEREVGLMVDNLRDVVAAIRGIMGRDAIRAMPCGRVLDSLDRGGWEALNVVADDARQIPEAFARLEAERDAALAKAADLADQLAAVERQRDEAVRVARDAVRGVTDQLACDPAADVPVMLSELMDPNKIVITAGSAAFARIKAMSAARPTHD